MYTLTRIIKYTSLSAIMLRRCCDISGNVGRSSGFTFQQFLIISYLKGKRVIFRKIKSQLKLVVSQITHWIIYVSCSKIR